MKWRILVAGNKTGTGIWLGDRKGKPSDRILGGTHVTAFFFYFSSSSFFFCFFS
jgi:hypothetical protein